jgi:hypothetical protein
MGIYGKRQYIGQAVTEETDEAIPESAFERDRFEILKAEVW